MRNSSDFALTIISSLKDNSRPVKRIPSLDLPSNVVGMLWHVHTFAPQTYQQRLSGDMTYLEFSLQIVDIIWNKCRLLKQEVREQACIAVLVYYGFGKNRVEMMSTPWEFLSLVAKRKFISGNLVLYDAVMKYYKKSLQMKIHTMTGESWIQSFQQCYLPALRERSELFLIIEVVTTAANLKSSLDLFHQDKPLSETQKTFFKDPNLQEEEIKLILQVVSELINTKADLKYKDILVVCIDTLKRIFEEDETTRTFTILKEQWKLRSALNPGSSK